FVVYVLVLLAVLAVPVLGRIGGGSRRWIPLGPVSIQPSEFMKLGLVLVLARHFARSYERGLGLRAAVVPMLLTAVPAAAILAQPDLGTVAILGIVSLTMLMLGGIRLRWFVLLGVVVAVAAPLAWPHLKVYQQKRILTFVHPEMDPRGAGYHVLQSKIAVGSGMMWGKGFLRGTQNQLNFLPEQHTDFIFSVFAEEWGFVGALVLIALYLALVLRGIVIATRARDRFGVLLVLGLTAIVFWQAVINVGMTTGLLPVVGIPLPFFSYGGSSLLCLRVGVCGLSSTFIFMTFSLPAYSRAISSTTGAIARQGAHQGAQKSISTGVGLASTSRSNESSATGSTSAIDPPCSRTIANGWG